MLYPAMLLGLLGLAVPVVIHLIQRQRLKPQPLATLRFLDREDLANAFAPVPRDWLQLLLRLILLSLFVLLMCRWTLSGSEPGPRTLAVVLDQSMSMRQRVGQQETLFDRSRRELLELIDGLREGDRLSLALVGDETTAATGLLSDRAQLRQLAEKFQVSDSGSRGLLPAIRRAVDQLRARRAVNACVIVFSDQQQAAFASVLGAADRKTAPGASLADELAASNVRVLFIDEPALDEPNLSIEQATFSPPRASVGASSRLTAVVRNQSKDKQTASLVVKDGESTGQQRSIALEPGEAAHVDLVQRFESPLDTVCRVELPEDVLSGDNQFFVPMRMRERRQVLIVAGQDSSDEPADTAVRYRGLDLLSYALNPGEALGLGGGTEINVKRVTPQSLQRVSLPLYSLVVIYGVTDLPDRSVKDLAALAKGGGILWFIPDPDVSPVRFNEAFAPLLHGMAIGTPAANDAPPGISRQEADVTHPLLLPLLRGEWGSVDDIYLTRYLKLASLGGNPVVLRATSGDPLIALASLDRGLVLLQTFACDLECSSFPRSAAFVPLVQRIVHGLTGRDERARPDMLRVGQTGRIQLPEFRGLQGKVELSGPENRTLALSGTKQDEARIGDLHQAGDYRLTHSARPLGRQRRLAVNPAEGESQLSRLSDDDIAELFGREHVQRVAFADLGGQFQNGFEPAALLGFLVLGALAVESLAGAWQSRRGARARTGGPR